MTDVDLSDPRMSAVFTSEEREWLSPVDLIAFMLYFERAKKEGFVPSAWLVKTPEQRAQLRGAVKVHFRWKREPTDVLDARIMNDPMIKTTYEKWIRAEMDLKRLRSEGVGRAYFAEYW